MSDGWGNRAHGEGERNVRREGAFSQLPDYFRVGSVTEKTGLTGRIGCVTASGDSLSRIR